VVCAEAGSVTSASAIAPVSNLNMANSLLYDIKEKPGGSILYCRNGFANHFVPEQRPQYRGELVQLAATFTPGICAMAAAS